MAQGIFQTPGSEEDRQSVFERSLGLLRALGTHASALALLFRIELREYRRRKVRYCVLLAAGFFLLLLAYLAMWAALLLWLGPSWGYALCALAFCALHAVSGLVVLAAAFRAKPGSPAPQTLNELKEDCECLRMTLGEKGKP